MTSALCCFVGPMSENTQSTGVAYFDGKLAKPNVLFLFIVLLHPYTPALQKTYHINFSMPSVINYAFYLQLGLLDLCIVN